MLPPLADQFVAGETPAEALEHARRLSERDVGAILNLLGEHYEGRANAHRDADAYCRLVADIGRVDLRACVSVKPTQLGLDVDESVFEQTLERVLERADEAGVFVWLDMEDHTTTDATLAAFERHPRDGLGVCLQANLRRTRDDIDRLAAHPGKLRLVKGAYDPPADVAYRTRARVNEAYRGCMEAAFAGHAGGVAVGTHDPAMIDYARALGTEYGRDVEVQMLMGVREAAQFGLASEVPVWQYVPYGTRWLSYFYRRVTERRENAIFALRALARRLA